MEQKNLHAWLETPLGQYVLRMEQDMLDQAVANVFGFNALQISWPHLDGLRANRIPHHMTLSTRLGGTIQAEPCALPLASQSLDLVVMPHALEFTEHPHALLREVDRVMRPEGRLIIVGFNPRSLWGVRQLFTLNRRVSPWSGHFISISRLKDWLALLSFDMDGGRFGAYAPPFTSARWLHRFRFMELAGDRWWGGGRRNLSAAGGQASACHAPDHAPLATSKQGGTFPGCRGAQRGGTSARSAILCE